MGKEEETKDKSKPATDEEVETHATDPSDSEDDESAKGKRRLSKVWYLAIAAVVVVALVSVGAVVGIRKRNKSSVTLAPSSAPSSTPTAAPTAPCYEPVLDPFSTGLDIEDFALPHFTLRSIAKEPCGPVAKANVWMLKDPNLEYYRKERLLQRFAMATLYYATDGDNWDNNTHWLSYDHDECQWFNQAETDTICNLAFSVLHLNLNDNNLVGSLPFELEFFPFMNTLNLSQNHLRGSVPVMPQYLKHLDLSENMLTGVLSYEPWYRLRRSLQDNVRGELIPVYTYTPNWNRRNLEVLKLQRNQLSDRVENLFKLFPGLVELDISYNQFQGPLPTKVSYLYQRSYNDQEPWLDEPTDFYHQLETLKTFHAAGNHISGDIPSEWGTAIHLNVLNLKGNPNLQGTIPTELAALTELTVLDIQDTSITGEFPLEFCTLQQQGFLNVEADCNEDDLVCCEV